MLTQVLDAWSKDGRLAERTPTHLSGDLLVCRQPGLVSLHQVAQLLFYALCLLLTPLNSSSAGTIKDGEVLHLI